MIFMGIVWADRMENMKGRVILLVNVRKLKKVDFISKKTWQGGIIYDIILGPLKRRHHAGKRRVAGKSFWKNFAKPLDKLDLMWYNKKVAERTAAIAKASLKRAWKKFKKLLKNLLTKTSGCDIINRLSTRRRAKIAHWKLNNNVLKRLRKFFWILKRSS